MAKSLIGKNVIITGANRGIGRAVVEKMASEGANIWACARIVDDYFKSEMSLIEKDYGVTVWPVEMKLNSEFEIQKGVKQILKTKGSIDVLVNNAGVGHAGGFGMTKEKELYDVFSINTFAPMILSKLIARKMMRQHSGVIVNVASIAGIDSSAGNCIYGPSKAALISFTRCFSSEMAAYGIRVNGVAPGPVDTDMVGIFAEVAKEHLFHRTPVERLAKPEEIANVIAFLASEEAGFVNGQIIRVDGGER